MKGWKRKARRCQDGNSNREKPAGKVEVGERLGPEQLADVHCLRGTLMEWLGSVLEGPEISLPDQLWG